MVAAEEIINHFSHFLNIPGGVRRQWDKFTLMATGTSPTKADELLLFC